MALLFISISLLTQNITAESYKVFLNSKHYNDTNITIEDFPNNDVDNTQPTNPSPYTEIGFFETDWKTTNDKKITLDTFSGLEWLDLSLTTSTSLAEMSLLLSTTYQGWRFPTKAEVNSLADRLFPNATFAHIGTTTTIDSNLHTNDSNNFLNLFGRNYTGTSMFGLYQKIAGNNVDHLLFGLYSGSSIYDDCKCSPKHAQNGIFLVSDGGTSLNSISNPNINIPLGN